MYTDDKDCTIETPINITAAAVSMCLTITKKNYLQYMPKTRFIGSEQGDYFNDIYSKNHVKIQNSFKKGSIYKYKEI